MNKRRSIDVVNYEECREDSLRMGPMESLSDTSTFFA